MNVYILDEFVIIYLLGVRIWRCNVTVTLADDGGMTAATNCIHKPMRIVVVNDMDKPPSAPWHPLH